MSIAIDVQLKLLQTLPLIVQNHPTDLRDSLIFGVVQTCAVLLSSTHGVVVSTASATLQQLVTSLFERLKHENKAQLQDSAKVKLDLGTHHVIVGPLASDAFKVC